MTAASLLISFFTSLFSRRFWFGKPIPTNQQDHQTLLKRVALAVFSSDALSSVAYATEAILIALLAANQQSLRFATPIAIGIIILLGIVAFSYSQTIIAYPEGGGTYIVSRENLGTLPSLTAGSALLLDYVLTVAVSMSAAVAAIGSAVPFVDAHRVEFAVGTIAVVTVINLRGVKESGNFMQIPTYAFLAAMFMLLGTGFTKLILGGGYVEPAMLPEHPFIPEEFAEIGFFFFLRAFAAGCTALTGIEAIADGVAVFKKPCSKNAVITLAWMAGILCTMFLGITVLANAYTIIPAGGEHPETAISQLAWAIFGGDNYLSNVLYLFVQTSTMGILIMASNTAYADFPRLASFLANDRFLPKEFAQKGDRLVFSRGVVALGVISSLLVIAFGAHEQKLLHLYAVGVFLSFTLSQAGMVKRWYTERGEGWLRSAIINFIGMIATGIVLSVIAWTKFSEGAWASILVIILIVMMFYWIHAHYAKTRETLTLDEVTDPRLDREPGITLVLVERLNTKTLRQIRFANTLSQKTYFAHIAIDPLRGTLVKEQWDAKMREWGRPYELLVVDSEFRSLVAPVRQLVDELRAENADLETGAEPAVFIILGQLITRNWLAKLLRLHANSSEQLMQELGPLQHIFIGVAPKTIGNGNGNGNGNGHGHKLVVAAQSEGQIDTAPVA